MTLQLKRSEPQEEGVRYRQTDIIGNKEPGDAPSLFGFTYWNPFMLCLWPSLSFANLQHRRECAARYLKESASPVGTLEFCPEVCATMYCTPVEPHHVPSSWWAASLETHGWALGSESYSELFSRTSMSWRDAGGKHLATACPGTKCMRIWSRKAERWVN